MMLRFTFLVLLVITLSHLCAQTFKGTIDYKVDIEVLEKMENLGVTQKGLEKQMKKEGTWIKKVSTTYTDSVYRTSFDRKAKAWLIYRSDSNKIYHFTDGEDVNSVIRIDADKDEEQERFGQMPTVSLLDTIVHYKFHQLKVVEVKCKTGSYQYMYSDEILKADPEAYKGHIYDGFYAYLKIAEAYPVIIKKLAKGTMVTTFSMTAYKAEGNIEESLFSIPSMVIDEVLNPFHFGTGTVMKLL